MRIFNKKYGELVAHTPDAHLNATIDAHDDVAFVGNYITAAGEVVRRPVAPSRIIPPLQSHRLHSSAPCARAMHREGDAGKPRLKGRQHQTGPSRQTPSPTEPSCPLPSHLLS